MGNIQQFTTHAGRKIYSFPVQSFSRLINNIYVIQDDDHLILVDSGSGWEQANQELQAGFDALTEIDPHIKLANLTHILITHDHIDHFGGLPYVRQFSDAPIGVHILDQRVLSNHEERVVFAARRLDIFLERAGVADKYREQLMEVYLFSKNYYASMPVQFFLEEGTPTIGGIQVYHVPGHCPGQVCLQVDDTLFTADHVLAKTTPHQAPESITNNMGLGHYLESLTKIEKLDGIRLGLGGHEAPVTDVAGRIQAIKQAHDGRLNHILDICRQPHSIADVSRALFGRVESYHVLLAVEEAGAHIEYLYQRGELVAANLDEIAGQRRPVVRYESA